MRNSTGFLFALLLGAIIGVGLTWCTFLGAFAGESAFGSPRIGAWIVWPSGDQGADSYTRARIARSGDLPLAQGEGVAFVATTDSSGWRLDGMCRYRVGPIAPPGRWWTLSLYDENGRLVSNPAGRNGFTSAEVVRDSSGAASITIGPDARPGNWLPSPPEATALILRAYDTPLSGDAAATTSIALPDITREGCP